MRMQIIAELLEEALEEAPPEKRAALAAALEQYAKQRWRTYHTNRQNSIMATLLTDAIAHATNARPGSPAV